jgi:hypothetical protein
LIGQFFFDLLNLNLFFLDKSLVRQFPEPILTEESENDDIAAVNCLGEQGCWVGWFNSLLDGGPNKYRCNNDSNGKVGRQQQGIIETI